MRNFKLMIILCLSIINTAVFADVDVVGLVEADVKTTIVEDQPVIVSPEVKAGAGFAIGERGKIALKFGGEMYQTCSERMFSPECKAVFDMLGEVEAGLKINDFSSASVIGRVTENKGLGGIKYDVSVLDDSLILNAKAMWGADYNTNRTVQEYGVGVTVPF